MKTTETEILSTGEQGPAGAGMLYGAGVPTANAGAIAAPKGSFYIDTTANDLYGPKTANGEDGEWGVPVSLVAVVSGASVLAAVQAMDAGQLTALRSALGFSTHNNLAAANVALSQGDAYFDLARSRLTTATN